MKAVNNQHPWSRGDIKTLRSMAKKATVAETARVLGRTAPATQQKAMRMGVSFR